MKNLNPVWDYETFYANIYEEELDAKTLEICVWDWDRFSKNDFLGMVRIDLFGKKLLFGLIFLFFLNKILNLLN